MPLNIAMIGAVSTTAGGAAVTSMPVPAYTNTLGCVMIVVGMMIFNRNSTDGMKAELAEIRSEAKRSSALNRKQTEILEEMQQSTNGSGPHTLPPPPLRRIV